MKSLPPKNALYGVHLIFKTFYFVTSWYSAFLRFHFQFPIKMTVIWHRKCQIFHILKVPAKLVSRRNLMSWYFEIFIESNDYRGFHSPCNIFLIYGTHAVPKFRGRKYFLRFYHKSQIANFEFVVNVRFLTEGTWIIDIFKYLLKQKMSKWVQI